MIEPDQLLDVATLLAAPPQRGAPRQARLRRAISSAYYALFHCFVMAGADLLAGANSRSSQRYLVIYRSFEHKRIADICRQVAAGRVATDTGNPFHATLRECAASFVELQEGRHDADYDPSKKFALSDAQVAISKAIVAIQRLNASPAAERFLFLTLLHFKLRA